MKYEVQKDTSFIATLLNMHEIYILEFDWIAIKISHFLQHFEEQNIEGLHNFLNYLCQM